MRRGAVTQRRWPMAAGPTMIALILLWSTFFASNLMAKDPFVERLQTSGLTGGLVVCVGDSEAGHAEAAAEQSSFLVHILVRNADNLHRIRERLRRRTLAGRVTVSRLVKPRLPFADNLVNFLVADDPGDLSESEVLRVLAPQGIAWVAGRRIVKQWPTDIDQWSHYLHGPDNNGVARDRRAGPPRHAQWLAGPRWTRDHHTDKGSNPSIRAIVSAGGKIVYLADTTRTSDLTVPSRWQLLARDAFNGVQLWNRSVDTTTYERRLEDIWRTLVASPTEVYTRLGTDQPIRALAASTGVTLRTYSGTVGVRELIHDDRWLVMVTADNRLVAFTVDQTEPRWTWKPSAGESIVPLTLAARQGRVFVKTSRGAVGLSELDGKLVWRHELPGPAVQAKLRFPHEKLLVADDVVLCSFGGRDPRSLNKDTFAYLGSHPRVHEYAGKLAALSTADGHTLWETAYYPGLESTPGEIYVVENAVWIGPDFVQPLDLHSGRPIGTGAPSKGSVIDRLWTTGHHYRCYPGKATCRYLLTAKRGIEFIDIEGTNHSRNNWVRATCRVGVTPCNGLVYAASHSCGCYMEAKLSGFWAFASETREPLDTSLSGGVLERGPAFDRHVPADDGPADDGPADDGPAATNAWPTYRGNARRSASTLHATPTDLNERWQLMIGPGLTAPTVAAGLVFVAQRDAHALIAIDADTGIQKWEYLGDGRIDSPPTYDRGRLLFGTRNGSVVCLRAQDGSLAWQRRVAPADRRVVAEGQLESVWPVHGAVLVRSDTAYVVAGRSSYLDGGITMLGLDPVTGAVRHRRQLQSDHVAASDPPTEERQAEFDQTIRQNRTDYKTFLDADRSDAFSMNGALPDILLSDSDSIYMRHLRFDDQLRDISRLRPHLFSTSTLLDDWEHNRSYWVLGTGDFRRTEVAYPWIVSKQLGVPYGTLLAFDKHSVWGIQRRTRRGQPTGHVLYASDRPDPDAPSGNRPDFQVRTGAVRRPEPRWTVDLPLHPRTLVATRDHLLVAGYPMTGTQAVTSKRTGPIAMTERPGLLIQVSKKDGREVSRVELSASPKWDSLAATTGRVYLALEDGSVVCLGDPPVAAPGKGD